MHATNGEVEDGCQIGDLRSLALLLCLVDFDEVCVHAALYDAVINHSSVGFK